MIQPPKIFLCGIQLLIVGLSALSSAYALPMTTASRVSGVAPLAVFFDAVEPANGIIQPVETNGRREYADFYYLWDYGDPDSGIWVDSGKSKNQDIGYTACHVYDRPGSYTITLTVNTPTGLTYSYTQTITVQDPDVIYSGENTICFSASGDFTSAPAGSLHVTTSNIMDLSSHVATGKRVLLRRGDVWNVSGQSLSFRSLPGPITIGAFGPGTADERGLYFNAPSIHVSNLPEDNFFAYWDVSDWRVMDIAFTGTGSHSAAGGAIGMSLLLHYRLQISGFSTTIGNSYWDTGGHDQWMLIGSDCHDSTGMVVYIGSERLGVVGNRIYNSNDTHVLRVYHSYKGFIAHNTLSGSSLHSTSGRHALKFHGPSETTINATDASHLDHRSQYTVIYDNVFGSSGPWPVAIGPQDTSSQENLQDILFTCNRVLSNYGEMYESTSYVQIALRIGARYVTVSNNIFDGTNASPYYTGIALAERSLEWAHEGNRIYNNTIYKIDNPRPGGYTAFAGIVIHADTQNAVVQNNLVVLPADALPANPVDNSGQGTIMSNNLLTTTPRLADPENSTELLKNFSPTSSSPAVNAGTAVPVIFDYTGHPRPLNTAWDLGAIEFGNSIQTPITVTVMDRSFQLREAYAFPNPATPGAQPTLRIVSGDLDALEITIFDKAGAVVHTVKLNPMSPTGFCNHISFYDYTWNGTKSSGVYFAVVHGKKGSEIIRARVKFAVIK